MFLVWVLMSLVFLIFFAMVNVQTDAYKKKATIADPFDKYAYLQVGIIVFFFVVRGQFWTAGAAMALIVFMVGVSGQIDKRREENNAGVRRAGERGH